MILMEMKDYGDGILREGIMRTEIHRCESSQSSQQRAIPEV